MKQFFYKVMLQNLNPVKANMLLGNSADERLLSALKEILRYLTEEMPNPKGIAKRQDAGEFPYADPEQEKFDFLRYALHQSYDFFEYIFTTNDTSPEEESLACFNIQRELYLSSSSYGLCTRTV